MKLLLMYLEMIDPRLLLHIKGKSGEMVKLLRDQQFVSEEAFIIALFGKNYNIKNYYSLKARTINMLQAFAIVTDTKGGSIVQQKNDLCQKNFLIAQKFLKKGKRKEGIRLIKQAYKIAVEYDLVYLACEFSSILFHNYMLYEFKAKKADFYASESQKYTHNYMAEKQAECYFLQATSKKNKARETQRLATAISNISALNGTSLLCLSYKSSLEVLHSFSIGDYHAAIKSSEEILKIYQGRKGAFNSHYQFYLTKSGIAHMVLGDYANASKNLKRAEAYVPSGSFNDYVLRLYQAINALHSGDYQEAYRIYRKYKKCRFESIRQQFAIIEAYICFLSQMGYLELSHTFRMGKFLNDTIASQANKQGENVAILIAELLIYFARDRDKYLDRVEFVINYSKCYLKGKHTSRAKHFIKILCSLPNLHFHPEALKRRMKKSIDYIHNNPVQIGEDIAFIEFIPFNKILDILMERLERRAVG